MSNTQIVFRCPTALQKRIAKCAEADRRTVSNWIRLVLEQAVEAAS